MRFTYWMYTFGIRGNIHEWRVFLSKCCRNKLDSTFLIFVDKQKYSPFWGIDFYANAPDLKSSEVVIVFCALELFNILMKTSNKHIVVHRPKDLSVQWAQHILNRFAVNANVFNVNVHSVWAFIPVDVISSIEFSLFIDITDKFQMITFLLETILSRKNYLLCWGPFPEMNNRKATPVICKNYDRLFIWLPCSIRMIPDVNNSKPRQYA